MKRKRMKQAQAIKFPKNFFIKYLNNNKQNQHEVSCVKAFQN